MSMLIHFPQLPNWGQQLASILPLAALLEFVKLERKLHVFELSGFNALWNWPVTPEGARLLLSDHDTTDACCLDRPGSSTVLHCIDCKFGNFYPCSAPATIRMYLKAKNVDLKLKNEWPHLVAPDVRQHTLDLLVVKTMPNERTKRWKKWGVRDLSARLLSIAALSWFCWISLLIIGIMGGLYIATAYLLCMPLTGSAVLARFGGQPRRLLGTESPGEISRLVVVTNSVNSCDWYAFYGPKNAVNGLLNRHLLRSDKPTRQHLSVWMITACAACQWILAVAACVLQGWDAFSITAWIAYCALTTEVLHTPEKAIGDWLRIVCRLEMDRIRVPFSARRALLAALVHLNPDSENTEWLDPILSKTHQERKDWENAVKAYSATRQATPDSDSQYWYKFIEEGVDLGLKVQEILKEREILKKEC